MAASDLSLYHFKLAYQYGRPRPDATHLLQNKTRLGRDLQIRVYMYLKNSSFFFLN